MNKRSPSLKERFTVTSEYTRGTGHNLYGKVVISVAPALAFSFRSIAAWPHECFEDAVLEGIREVLEAAELDPALGAEFVLQDIGWRDTESCWDSYYQAAKQAAREILQKTVPTS